MRSASASVSVFEFGYLGNKNVSRRDAKVVPISDKAFAYLETQCLKRDLPFIQLRTVNGHKVIQVKSHVGVIITPDGEQIEILPKTGKHSTQPEQAARQELLLMLQHLEEFRHIQMQTASVDTAKLPLLEVFISQFLESVSHLVKRGLRSDYVSQQDNLAYQKGKLLVAKQLQHNFINKHRFFVAYDEFLLDRPENRLIHSAMIKIRRYTRSVANQKLLQEQVFAFHDVPLSHDIAGDLDRLKLDRNMGHYQQALAWARLILQGLSPLSMQGKSDAMSLLFPMEAVFESYVASILKKRLKAGFTLHTQTSGKALAVHKGSRYFRLKPDILIQKTGLPTDQKNYMVLDTKWKLIDIAKGNSSDKYGLSQADFYQMFAYGHKYLNGKGDLFLIYPAHDRFGQAVESCFDLAEGTQALRLWVVPFVIGLSEHDSRLITPSCLNHTLF